MLSGRALALWSLSLLFACGAPPQSREPVRSRERVVPIELFADLSARQEPHFWSRAEARIATLSRRLAPLSIRLEVRRRHSWETGGERRLFSLYEQLSTRRSNDPKTAAASPTLWIGWTQQPPGSYAPLNELSYGVYGSPIIIMRSLDSYFSDWKRRPEYAQRLANAEQNLLLRRLVMTFGGIAGCGQPGQLLSASPAHLLGQRRDRSRRPIPMRRLPLSSIERALLQLHLEAPLSFPPSLEAEVAERALALSLSSSLQRCQNAADRLLLWGTVAYASDQSLRIAREQGRLTHRALAPLQALAEGLEALSEGDFERAEVRCRAQAERLSISLAGRCAGIAAARLGKDQHAERYLRGWLSASAQDLEARLELALALGRQGNDAAAARQLTSCLAHGEASPLAGRILLNLGIAEARLGRYRSAERRWRAVPEGAKERPEAEQLLADLRAQFGGVLNEGGSSP
ncbi:MAG: hypothetical protein VYD19_02740 [Myxococcota bacterium]|nr:hypothetical protein [Myxococcota bacterium]